MHPMSPARPRVGRVPAPIRDGFGRRVDASESVVIAPRIVAFESVIRPGVVRMRVVGPRRSGHPMLAGLALRRAGLL